jgi:hypothetical protein
VQAGNSCGTEDTSGSVGIIVVAPSFIGSEYRSGFCDLGSLFGTT